MKILIPRWAIKNPVIVAAMYMGVLALAVIALLILPVRMMPYIQSPLVAIVTMATGSSPRSEERRVGKEC